MLHHRRLLLHWARAADRAPSALVLALGSGCVALAVLLTLTVSNPGTGPQSSTFPHTARPVAAPSTDSPPEAVPTRRVAHRPGRFLVDVPRNFTVSRRGERVVVASPDRGVVATVAPAGGGPSGPVVRSLVDTVRDDHRDVVPSDTEVRHSAGRSVRVAEGRATKPRRGLFFYVAAAVTGRYGKVAVTALAAEERAPHEVVAQVDTLLDSARALPPRGK